VTAPGLCPTPVAGTLLGAGDPIVLGVGGGRGLVGEAGRDGMITIIDKHGIEFVFTR
jgi:hypothetical protein